MRLKELLGVARFSFYEGSEVIASVIPGGLAEFHQASEEARMGWRQAAIHAIGRASTESGRVAVVTGHFMLWTEGHAPTHVYTDSALQAYTHILYLDFPPDLLFQRRASDHSRHRPDASVGHLRSWQRAEKAELRQVCLANGILFASVSDPETSVERAATMLLDFSLHTEEHNLSFAEHRLDEIISMAHGHGTLETTLVMDADRTLAAEDTGALFWAKASQSRGVMKDGQPLEKLFGGPFAYSYTSFRQAMLLYEECFRDDEFDYLCEVVAAAVTFKVKVMGGGRISDGFVMTGEVKGLTTIVALMRGGEPMALGVNGAMPGAMFVHAKQREELKPQYLKGQWRVVLVDSVVNNGKTMLDFVQQIRSLDMTIAIVLVAGVVQVQALSMVALRLSENKFAGKGTTDTGNRLYNTMRHP
ncbi:hypothetical protein VTI74DRAFT_3002 [Chaetomium olivicolor]